MSFVVATWTGPYKICGDYWIQPCNCAAKKTVHRMPSTSQRWTMAHCLH